MSLTPRCLERLAKVHPDLKAVVMEAAKHSDFRVVEGMRTIQRQRELVAAGASRTMNSRHLTGHAVDIAPTVGGTIRWDWPLFYPMADAMKSAAQSKGVPITWGGDWKMRDGPHFELSRSKYP